MVALILEREKPSKIREELPSPAPQASPAPNAPAAATWRAVKQPHALHGRIYKLLALFNAGILVAFWFTFQADREALFMVAISAFYLAAYLGAPFMLTRVGRVDPPSGQKFDEFLDSRFETWTGAVSGRVAMIQILAVPAGLFLAAIGFGLIIRHAS